MEVDPPPAAPAPAEPGSPPAVNPAPVAPRRIGHWQVDKQIGRGSFAVVWRARHAETGQRVAVKEIRLDKLNRKLRESLESEIQVLQRSRHGNIIRLHDIIKEEKRIFLVLEYCAGGDVSEFIKKHGRVREDVARHFMRQMASGLRAMRAEPHTQGSQAPEPVADRGVPGCGAQDCRLWLCAIHAPDGDGGDAVRVSAVHGARDLGLPEIRRQG